MVCLWIFSGTVLKHPRVLAWFLSGSIQLFCSAILLSKLSFSVWLHHTKKGWFQESLIHGDANCAVPRVFVSCEHDEFFSGRPAVLWYIRWGYSALLWNISDGKCSSMQDSSNGRTRNVCSKKCDRYVNARSWTNECISNRIDKANVDRRGAIELFGKSTRREEMRDPAAFKIPRSKLPESNLPRAEAEENFCDSGNWDL